MKQSLFISAVAALLLSASVLSPAVPRSSRAAVVSENSQAAQSPDPANIRREYFGSVVEINYAERMFTVRDNSLGMQTLHVDGRTNIRMGDKSANWSDIRAGVMVDGICVGAQGNAYAETVNLGR